MRRLFRIVDDLLRGNLTRKEDLAVGRIDVPARQLVVAGLLLGGVYGVCMGIYAVLRAGNPSVAQLLATTLKVPLLFVLTLFVSYPSLYVVSALFNSRLRHAETLRLLLLAMCVSLALLASLGPVTVFFTLSTESYHFMIVLNVFFFSIAGLAGTGFMEKALREVFGVEGESGEVASEQDGNATPPAGSAASDIAPVNRSPKRVFTLWILIYGVVGAQMGWILRPFIGSPDLEFVFFRQRESNFFEALFRAIGQLLS